MGRTSPVWDFYTHTADEVKRRKATCKMYTKQIAISYNTTNMLSHMTQHHPEQHERLQNLIKSKSANATSQACQTEASSSGGESIYNFINKNKKQILISMIMAFSYSDSGSKPAAIK